MTDKDEQRARQRVIAQAANDTWYQLEVVLDRVMSDWDDVQKRYGLTNDEMVRAISWGTGDLEEYWLEWATANDVETQER